MSLLTSTRVLSLITIFNLLFLNVKVLAQNSETKPLESILNPDGTLNLQTGKGGSFNPKGFNITYGKNGEPIFVPSGIFFEKAPGDENWDDQFFIDGVDAEVKAIAIDSTGNLFIGGEFSAINGTPIRGIAKWNGSDWSALGSGINDEVFALAVNGNDIYVGGYFTIAGGISVNRIAKWDGSNWSPLGSGANNTVLAIAVKDTEVYAGGHFTTIGGVSATRIAKWNGIDWSPMDTGVNDRVNAIAVKGDDIYVGGDFTTAGGILVNRIAKWDGSNWLALRGGMDNDVFAIVVKDNDVYVGGSFTNADTISANRIAKWDGSNWSALGSGVNSVIYALAINDSGLYAGGGFSNRIEKWDGNNWSTLGSGVAGGSVNAIKIRESIVYVGGSFTDAGGVPANKIATWNGSTWSDIGQNITGGNGVYGFVEAIGIGGGNVYIGGSFTSVGGISANRIAKWDGSNWYNLGSGVNNLVKAIVVKGNDVYAGGIFSTAGGNSANYIAKWDGNNWSPLGTGLDTHVHAIAIDDSNVYAGGRFTTAGGISANYIAKWDGNNWSPLGSGVNNSVEGIAISGDDVYIIGGFNTAGGNSANHIAKWDGNNWLPLGSGLDGISFSTIAVSNGDVYAAGFFWSAGGISANNIAKWNGSSWSTLGDGVAPYVNAITTSGNDVYASGYFTSAGGLPANHVAKWDGSDWSILGSGLNGNAYGIALNGIDVCVSGSFTTAGGKPSANFGIYHIPEPIAQPTNLSFSNITESSFTILFSPAVDSPDGYIAIRRTGSSPTFIPIDSTTYVVDQTVGDGTVAYIGNDVTFNETSLYPDIVYHYDIFSFNGSGPSSNYLTTSPLEGSQSTMATQPTAQPTNMTFSNITETSLTVSFTEAAGSPSGYLAIRKANSSPISIPDDGIFYSPGETIGLDTVAYVGSNTTFNDTGLTAGKIYHYDIFSYNGSGPSSNYLTTSPLESNQSTMVAQPTAQPTNISFLNITTSSFLVSFNDATGSPDGYIAIRRESTSPTFVPVDGITYNVGQTVGDGIVAYSGSSISFNQTGLNSNTLYCYDIFSYNGSGLLTNYLSTSPLEGSRTTLEIEPINQPTNLIFSNITTSSFLVSFTAAAGSPAGYLALRRLGSSPTGSPIDGTTYSVNDSIGDAVIAFIGNNTSWADTGLSQGEYYYDIFSYNGVGAATNYLITNPLENSQSTIITEPIAQASNMIFSNITDSSFSVSFTEAAGSPTGYLAIRRVGSSPTYIPNDGTTFTIGQPVGDGTVAYVGNSLTFDELGLTASTTYFYDIFSYNGSGLVTNYLTTAPLEGSQSTLAQEPIAQPTNLTFPNRTESSLTILFASAIGSPDGYIGLRKVNSSPSSLPIDGQAYTVGDIIGIDTVAYFGNGTTFIDTGLITGTTYYYDIFSYNGSGTVINYLTTAPLEGNQSTILADINGPNFSNFVFPDTVQLNNSVPVSVDVTDLSGINSVDLYYKISGDPVFSSIQMILQSGATWSTDIPSSNVTEKGVEFYIEAEDSYNNLSYSITYYVKILLTSGLTNTAAQPAGSSLSDYRIFSLPLNPDNSSPEEFIAANPLLVNYDQVQCRLYDVQNQNLREYPNIGNFTPGKGFLFITNISNLRLTAAPGKSVNSTQPFIISLPEGWSLMGNPFFFNIPYDSLSVSSGTFELREYTGTNGWQSNTTGLEPWKGYAIYMSQSGNFIINPGVAGLNKPSNYYSTEFNDETNWLVQIKADNGLSVDYFNFIGQDEDAADDYDKLDLHEAPRIGKQVNITFSSDNTENHQLTTNIHATSEDGHSWNVTCLTDPESESLSLFFDGINTIPENFDAFLIDIVPNIAYNLKNNSNLKFISTNLSTKELKLAIGTKEFLSSLKLNVDLYPTEFRLLQNFPNPFNLFTQIVFVLPEMSDIELKLFNTMGQLVTTIYKGVKETGTHNVIWNAKDIASGVYFYQLKSKSFTDYKKCVLIK
jgi:hypothetical protein